MNAPLPVREDVPVAPIIIRGKIYTDNLIEYGGRGGDLRFASPDASKYLDQLVMGNSGKLADLYQISFNEILGYLEALGQRLDLKTNEHLQRACELSYLTAPTTPSIVKASYSNLGHFFTREAVTEVAEKTIGVPYLEGWVEEQCTSGARLQTRCFGARTLHIVAGNSPMISVMSIIRNAILRSDAIIKAPSNDPFTALAIAQTMCELDPDHPISQHPA